MSQTYLNLIKDRVKIYLRLSGWGIYRIPKYARADHHYRYLYYKRLHDSIRNLDGDIVECGVGIGGTLSILTGITEEEGKNRMVYGFDSFEGFPEPSEYDKSPRNPQKGEWHDATPDSIMTLLKSVVNPSFIEKNVHLVKGFVANTLPDYTGKIALLHIDVNLYESNKSCLENLYQKVVPGGVILFDEYRNRSAIIKFPGAIKAIEDFFGDNKNLLEWIRNPICIITLSHHP